MAGFDDHPMSVYWGLTTITQHAHEQGARAALALLAALDEDLDDGQSDGSDLVKLTVQLVPRETTRAVSGVDSAASDQKGSEQRFPRVMTGEGQIRADPPSSVQRRWWPPTGAEWRSGRSAYQIQVLAARV